jgi:hypothetical protein
MENLCVMALTVPSWFKQRQAKAEEAGENHYRLTGPNLREAYIGLRPADGGHWTAYLRFTPDGPDAAVSPESFATQYNAWEAAFELHRCQVVV